MSHSHFKRGQDYITKESECNTLSTLIIMGSFYDICSLENDTRMAPCYTYWILEELQINSEKLRYSCYSCDLVLTVWSLYSWKASHKVASTCLQILIY